MRVAVLMSMLSLFCLPGCDEKKAADEPKSDERAEAKEAPAGDKDCHDRAVSMAGRLEPFTKVQPTLNVPFPLPEASGRTLTDGTPVLVGPKVVRVDEQTFDVPDGDDPIADGNFSADLVDRVRDAIASERKKEAKEAELLNAPSVFVVWLGVHPEMPASAVQPFFAEIEKDTPIGVLVVDAEAPSIPEREVVAEVEPLLDKLDAADEDDDIRTLTQTLEEQVVGDCGIAFFRMWVGDKTGASTLDREMLLQKTPLAEAVAECGCDEVDLASLEAVLGWAMTPPHGPLALVPSSYQRAFANPEQAWGDVVKRHAQQ
jgi:hypothetical protein